MSQPPYPPPPSAPPPPPPPPQYPQGQQAAPGSNRNLMLALSYLWLLAIVPLIVEKDDKDVQWHAKHGLVLVVAEIALCAVLAIVFGIVHFIPFVGCLAGILGVILSFVLPLGILILHTVMIMKAMNGERFLIPGLSDFANKF
jgi:uncharacterized membrane protein